MVLFDHRYVYACDETKIPLIIFLWREWLSILIIDTNLKVLRESLSSLWDSFSYKNTF
jgi:hypothetical protein